MVLASMYLCPRSGYTDDARQNECKTRVRIYREFQSDAKCVQGEADREGAFAFFFCIDNNTPLPAALTAHPRRETSEM